MAQFEVSWAFKIRGNFSIFRQKDINLYDKSQIQSHTMATPKSQIWSLTTPTCLAAVTTQLVSAALLDKRLSPERTMKLDQSKAASSRGTC